MPTDSPSTTRVRLDKWLWAARFFKTRSLAKQAIEGGKVHYEGDRCKVSKEVEVGATLTVRQGWDEREVVVAALSEQRRGAAQAQQLYRETEASLAHREEEAARRRVANRTGLVSHERPNKKQRRQIHRFKQQWNDDG